MPWGFNWKYRGIPFEHDETPQIVKETGNYLDMWFLLEISYDKLSATEKKKVKAANYNEDVRFPGFDGNHEDNGSVAHYLIDHLERFEHFKGRNMNSHMPSIGRYTRMYSVFEPMRSGVGAGHLTPDQIIQVLNGGIHPSQRT